jgi:hypothetical protein
MRVESIQTGKVYEGSIPEGAQEALENFVHAKKAYLEVIAEETANAVERPKNHKPMERTEVTEVAMNATKNFIDAQRNCWMSRPSRWM